MPKIHQEIQLGFDDLMLKQIETSMLSRDDVSLVRAFNFRYASGKHTYTPIIASNMDGVGTWAMAKSFKAIHENPDLKGDICTVAITKGYANEKYGDPVEIYTGNYQKFGNTYLWYTIGLSQLETDMMIKINAVLPEENKIDKICIDAAHGGMTHLSERVSRAREVFPNAVIMAGNVVTAELTQKLIHAGADIVKVGVGPGSVCTTRSMTGVGRPQASAVMECALAAHELGAHICADGGMKQSGDMVKAFGLGADFIMLGGYLAGHQESAGSHPTCEFRIETDSNGAKTVQFHGMSSQEAQEKHVGEMKSHRGSEGKSVMIPFKGSAEETVRIMLNNIRSGGTYINARTIEEYPEQAEFYQVREQLNLMFK